MTAVLSWCPMGEKHFRTTALLWPVLFAVLAFYTTYHSPNSYVGSDPRGTLLTAQAILQHGSLKLDEYSGRTYVPALESMESTGHFRKKNGHCYYYFPVGSSIFTLPVVHLANLQGEDMAIPEDDAALQNLLSALTTSLCLLLIFKISRYFLGLLFSALATVTFVFGSSLTSTMGTALWNANLSVVFVLLSLHQLVRSQRTCLKPNPYMLGFFLVSACLCRPTTFSYVVVVFLFLWLTTHRVLFRMVLTSVLLVLLFFALSWAEYGQLLPGAYMLGALPGSTRLIFVTLVGFFCLLTFLYASGSIDRRLLPRLSILLAGSAAAVCVLSLLGKLAPLYSFFALGQRLPLLTLQSFYGHLLSPARGLLVYSPFLVITSVGVVAFKNRLKKEPLFWLSIGWFVLHLVTISRPFRWWGGHCFGSRLFTEAFPSVIVLTLLVLEQIKGSRRRARHVVWIAFAVTSLGSVLINTGQGLYNRHTTAWNASPDIDLYPKYLFNWKYPQFLASQNLLAARNLAHEKDDRVEIELRSRNSYNLGTDLNVDSPVAYFHNWSEPEIDHAGHVFRTSQLESDIWFWLARPQREYSALVLELDLASDEICNIAIAINDRHVGSVTSYDLERTSHRLSFDPALLNPHTRNSIGFHPRLGEAPQEVAGGETRAPSQVRLWRLRIAPSE